MRDVPHFRLKLDRLRAELMAAWRDMDGDEIARVNQQLREVLAQLPFDFNANPPRLRKGRKNVVGHT